MCEEGRIPKLGNQIDKIQVRVQYVLRYKRYKLIWIQQIHSKKGTELDRMNKEVFTNFVWPKYMV